MSHSHLQPVGLEPIGDLTCKQCEENGKADFSDKFCLDITMQPYLAFYARGCGPLKASADGT